MAVHQLNFSALRPVQIPDPLERYKTIVGLQGAQLQNQDTAAQIQERNAIAQQRQAATLRGQQVAQAMHDYLTANPDAKLDDEELIKRISAIDPTLGEAHAKSWSTIANQNSEIATRKQTADTAAGTLAETQKKNVFDQTKEKDAIARKNAEEAAGIIVPGTEFTTDKQERAAQFRVRQPDGTYVNEVRVLGKQGAAPRTPVPGTDIPYSADVVNQKKQIAEAGKAATFNANNPAGDAQTVSYWADQVESNPLNWGELSGNKTLQNQVRAEIAIRGRDVNRLTSATRQLGETADTVVPKIDALIKKLDDPKYAANLGPIMGRWNEFWTGKVGTNDPDLAAIRAQIGLTQTGVMRAHVGARGGESLLQKFESLADSTKMDAATLKGSLTGMRDFLQGYRDKIHPVKGRGALNERGLVVPGGALDKLIQGQK